MSRIGEATTCSAVKLNLIQYINVADICSLIAYDYAVDCILVWSIYTTTTTRNPYRPTIVYAQHFRLSEFTTIKDLLIILHFDPTKVAAGGGLFEIEVPNKITILHNLERLQCDDVLSYERHCVSSTLNLRLNGSISTDLYVKTKRIKQLRFGAVDAPETSHL